ncbi:hypothetical protein RI054_03g19210 [Pseudoscourfieldia marina]|mmetsp:Transcript_4520/g.11193  ORF Transcript_4520/g.11193 Transcript_4520/m.11193 type:complete len:176 (-) Transcript_4520:49-576(-)|eukprot:CAMPEP_0119204820 /NCGR_PEP_ID=MMETSP1316-20130426/38464_1 /TAXON_ID=41880 /ORGANISM="Pycnococcus provasolii, Strain RCC2336" /LENGTH=175 /DNA_ID=CAMNT_0007201155 /DNA_START=23 /DNA_END=550 /DNA_ORIENTATION=+
MAGAAHEVTRWQSFLRDTGMRSELPKEGRDRLLKTWTAVGKQFPKCERVARTYNLAKEVATHAVECSFSTASALVTPYRNRLSAWKVESFLLLRLNAMLIKQYAELAEAKDDLKNTTRAVRQSVARKVTATEATSLPLSLPPPSDHERKRLAHAEERRSMNKKARHMDSPTHTTD